MRRCTSIAGSLVLFMLFVWGTAFSQEDPLVAKVGDRKITRSDFNRVLSFFDAEKLKSIEKNPQAKEQILQQMVQAYVISDLAKQKGYDTKPDIKEQLELLKNSFIANEYLKREVIQKVMVPETELKAYYDANMDEFKLPEMIRASHILFLTEASSPDEAKKKVYEKAVETLKKIKEGEDFAKLASELSGDPGSKPKGGDIGFVAKGKTVKPFEDALFSLKPGEISGVIETQFGFHIIKAVEKKDASVETFDSAREKIIQKLSQERRKTAVTEFIDKAMKDAKVEMYREGLSGQKE